MDNKAFTNGVGLTRSGPNDGDLLAVLGARGEENFATDLALTSRASASGG